VEALDYFDEVFYGPWSATRSATYGFGHLRIHNHTHLHWSQELDEGRAGVDQFWLVKDRMWAGMDKSVLRATHPFSARSSACDHYCYRVCIERVRKLPLAQQSVHKALSCVPRCSCQREARNGQLQVVGAYVKKAKLHRKQTHPHHSKKTGHVKRKSNRKQRRAARKAARKHRKADRRSKHSK